MVTPAFLSDLSLKRFSNKRNLKTLAFRFSVENILQTELLENNDAKIIT